MSIKGVKVKLAEIQVNKENFRHSPLKNELEAIHYLVSEDYESYLNLAKEIQKDCRTFTALLLEKNGNRILMDANRRVSVLKIFEDPTLIPNGSKYDDLRNMCIARGSLQIPEITADIYFDEIEEDRENLMTALNELHVKDNNTRKNWNALSQYRASKFIGSIIKHPWIRSLEYYGLTDEQIIKITYHNTDIFNRILRKSQLNILENGKFDLSNDDVIMKKIIEIVKDNAYYLDGKIIKVNTRTHKTVYQAIVDDLIKKYSIGQLSISISDLENEKIDNSQKNKSPKLGQTHNDVSLKEESIESEGDELRVKISKPLKRDVETRSSIISNEQKKELSTTSSSQVNQIAHELSMLNLNTFIISGPIILRSFLQYSVEWYAEKEKIQFNHNNLLGTITSVINKMFELGIIKREEKGTLNGMLRNSDVINLLNEVTHNFQASAIPKTILIDFYNSLHPLMKNIYK